MSAQPRVGCRWVARFVPVLVLVLSAGLLSGCTASDQQSADGARQQQARLQEYIEQADAWGADILAQIPAEEMASVSANYGGERQADDLYREWPKYYYWAQGVDLHPDGPRTPTALADDLDPWLGQQGWVRREERELPAGKESFERDYTRDGYTLAVEVHTVAPPRAQTVDFTIVSPQTDSAVKR
jgi:hypothetical protein